MLVDSHCHLDFPDFAAEIDAVVARAQAAGLAKIVTISTRVRRHAEVLAIAERFENVFCSVGTHPHCAHEELDVTAGDLAEKTRHPKVVGIGEVGLDYHYDNSPREAQERGLRTHIAAARTTGLPLIIHCRDADADMARTGVELGMYVSFSGILTFKKSDALRSIAAELPADRILVETDAPYLAPQPWRGKRNEPAYVVETARVLAQGRGVDAGEIARQTTENFFRLFAKVPRTATVAA